MTEGGNTAVARPPKSDTDDRDPGAPRPDTGAATEPPDDPLADEPKGDLDDGGLSPEDVLLAAIRQSRRETLGAVPDDTVRATADTGAPESVSTEAIHHLPLIDRPPVASTPVARPPAHPAPTAFAAAPEVLPQNDSGAGMGFEFSLARRPGRRNR